VQVAFLVEVIGHLIAASHIRDVPLQTVVGNVGYPPVRDLRPARSAFDDSRRSRIRLRRDAAHALRQGSIAMFSLMMFAAVAAVGCRAENARYALRHDPDITAFLRKIDSGPDWPSGLVLAVHSRKSDQTSWWLPWNGGTDGRQNIASTTPVTDAGWRPPDPDGGPRPHGNRELLSMDSAYNVLDRVPEAGRAAPAHMLISNSGSSSDPVFTSRQFFDLVGCSATDD
jgi:hypothetical protein